MNDSASVKNAHHSASVKNAHRRTAAESLVPALRDMLVLFALTGGVWLVHVYGRTLPTTALAALWAAITLLISAGLVRRARMRRGAFLAAYVSTASPLARWLRGGFLLAARWLIVAAALSLVLLIALLRLDAPGEWIVLIGTVPVVVLAYRLVGYALSRHLRREYLPELTWRITAASVGALMLAALVAIAFYRPYPDFAGVSLERAVWHYVNAEHARSGAAETLLQLAAAKDALRLWLAQQLMPQPGTSLVQALGWLIVFAEESVFVWSYLLLAGGVLVGFDARDRSSEETR
jgi:hypothetical protein